MNYYISDMHFGHRNVLKYDKRPFSSVEEMDEILISNWNRKVKDHDDIWILGDFCYHSEKDPAFYLKQLKGKKHLIVGNHDRVTLSSDSAIRYFKSIERMQHIKDGKENIIMCHFPIADWNAKKRGCYHIYGHIHNARDDIYEFMRKQERALNAGCMINNYEPATLEELIENNKRFQSQ
ncbi:MAG: metallophosphoesterase family protein [Clostridiales bacterium]|nr:metallophosphoesterase family protein [Clostridiales bacterium]